MRDIRTITLDLDDTLWAIGPVIARAERRLYEWLQDSYPRVTEKYSPQALVEVRNNVIADNHARRHDFSFLRRTVLAHVGEAAGYAEVFVEEAMHVFLVLRNEVELFPEVRPSLQALGEKYRIVAVTNGNACLDRIGIRDLFDDCVSAASAGAAKPAREIFDIAVEAGGAAAHETLHVGDHPEIDVVGANEAGLRSAWMNRNGDEWPGHLQQPDVIIGDVAELLAALRGA